MSGSGGGGIPTLLLIAADWQSRALAVAELQDRGYDVMALPGLRYAVKALVDERVVPLLIVLDVHDDEDATPRRVEQLLDLAPDAPLILIVGVYDRATWEPLRVRAAAWLQRPVSVGEVAEAVERVMPRPYNSFSS